MSHLCGGRFLPGNNGFGRERRALCSHMARMDAICERNAQAHYEASVPKSLTGKMCKINKSWACLLTHDWEYCSCVVTLDTQLPRLNVLQYKRQVDVFVNISTQGQTGICRVLIFFVVNIQSMNQSVFQIAYLSTKYCECITSPKSVSVEQWTLSATLLGTVLIFTFIQAWTLLCAFVHVW